MRKWRLAVSYVMMWTRMLSPKGPLRVCSGHKPLAVLPWELVKEVGRKKGGKRKEEREGWER